MQTQISTLPPTAMPEIMAVVRDWEVGGGARAYLRAKREVLIMKRPAVTVGGLVELSGIRGTGGSVTQGLCPAMVVE